MSTKIYYAYRFPKKLGLFDTMSKIREDGIEVVKQNIRGYFDRIMSAGKTLDETGDIITKMYKAAVVDLRKNPFNFDMSISIHEYEDYYYLIPYAVTHDWKFLDDNPQLEEFGYWNNTDMPEEMSEEEWDERARIWDGIDDAGWQKQLVCIINNYEDLLHSGVHFDLQVEEWKKSEKES